MLPSPATTPFPNSFLHLTHTLSTLPPSFYSPRVLFIHFPRSAPFSTYSTVPTFQPARVVPSRLYIPHQLHPLRTACSTYPPPSSYTLCLCPPITLSVLPILPFHPAHHIPLFIPNSLRFFLPPLDHPKTLSALQYITLARTPHNTLEMQRHFSIFTTFPPYKPPLCTILLLYTLVDMTLFPNLVPPFLLLLLLSLRPPHPPGAALSSCSILTTNRNNIIV